MPPRPFKQLTAAQADQFVQQGWIKLENCFTREQSDQVTRDVWVRLGMSPTDKSTWQEDNHMPTQNRWFIKDFAPKAWDAMCDIVGGEHLVCNPKWSDGFIVNLGTPEGEGKDIPPDQWHVDGQMWVNFLDTPNQGLLIMPLFSDIRPGGGGTMICPAALPRLAQHLYDHPEGVMPGYRPINEPPRGPHHQFQRRLGLSMSPDTWVEVTGKPGDVYILHPFMLHSRVNNKHRDVRIVTNNRFPIKEPFNYDRADPNQYTLVERATLKALGRENLKGWHITGKRELLQPNRAKRGTQQEERQKERERVTAAGHGHIYNR